MGETFRTSSESSIGTPHSRPPRNRLDLPSPEDAPILEPLGELSFEEFRRQHALETPLDSRGFVDYPSLLELVSEQMREGFLWPNVEYDVHHLQWAGNKYAAEQWSASTIPMEFREVPFHKLYIPRQLHNFIHAITREPETPSHQAMFRRVKAYRRAVHLFTAAQNSLHYERAESIGRPVGEGTLLIPKSADYPKNWGSSASTSRVIAVEVLLDRYEEFTTIFKRQLAQAALHDFDGLFKTVSQDLEPHEIIDTMVSVLPIERRSRAALRPPLKVDMQHMTRRAA